MKVALYARVSTDDKDQNSKTQLIHLRKFAETFNHRVFAEYVDEGKSAKTIKGRTEHIKMMEGVDANRFDAVIAYKLDRFHRNTFNAIAFVDHLRLKDIALILTSQNIDTSTAMGMAMMQITAIFAELESANTSERSRLGTERTKAEGKICNRPTIKLSDYQINKAKQIIDVCVTSPPYWAVRDYHSEPVVWGGSDSCDHSWEDCGHIKNNPQSDHDGGRGSELWRKESAMNAATGQFCNRCGAWEGQLGLEQDYNLYIEHLMMILDEVRRVLKPSGSCWVNIGDTYNGYKVGKTDKKASKNYFHRVLRKTKYQGFRTNHFVKSPLGLQ